MTWRSGNNDPIKKEQDKAADKASTFAAAFVFICVGLIILAGVIKLCLIIVGV